MGTNPTQGQNPDPSDTYGGYGGYRPSKPSEDPYGAYSQQADQQQQSGAGNQQGDPDYVYGQRQQQQQQQQFSGSYQPPMSAMRGRSSGGPNDATSVGLNARRAGLLSYLVGPFSGIVFLLLERRNQFVRFCAAQSIVVFGPVFVLYLILRLIMIIPFIGTFLLAPIIGGCIIPVVLILSGLLWIFLMVQAYRGVQVKLPIVGGYANALLARFSRHR